MEQIIFNDIVEWDVINWTKAIKFWEVEKIYNSYGGKTVLDIGARGGGLSLYFANLGADVVCSDLEEPGESAKELHKKYNLSNKIEYRAVNATTLIEKNKYDIICFKSVLGGIGYGDNYEAQLIAINNIYNALKPGGYLLFAENTAASPIHMYLRKKYNNWSTWRYIKLSEVDELCKQFNNVSYNTFGFFGTFGRSERQRRFLSRLDNVFTWLIPRKNRYIVSVVAQKSLNNIL